MALPTILILGANGQVGFELQRSLAPYGNIIAATRKQCDLSQPELINSYIRQATPNIIVNAAAYTAVDKAESEPQLAEQINGNAPTQIAELAAELGATLVHYSTDYVFDGNSEAAYTETDQPNPVSVYGKTKLAGEQGIQQIAQQGKLNAYILRTAWVFGLHGNNFLKTMLRLAQQHDSLNVVADQHGSPTSAALIADITALLLQKRPDTGIYHLAANGQTNWQGYAQFAINTAIANGLETQKNPYLVNGISTSEYPTAAKRPSYSLLNCEKLERALGIAMPNWQGSVTQSSTILTGHS